MRITLQLQWKKTRCQRAKLHARIKPTALCLVFWQRELDRVPIRFSTLLIQLLHGLCTTFPCLSCDPSCDVMWCDCDYVTLCDVILSHTPLCSKSKIKEKKRNININNDLVVLPSHDTRVQRSEKM